MTAKHMYRIPDANLNIKTTRYSQNETINNNIIANVRTDPREYITDVINSNNLVFSDSNAITWGLDCYIIHVSGSTVHVYITPGAAIIKEQVVTVPNAYIVTMDLPFLIDLNTYSRLGVFMIRTDPPSATPFDQRSPSYHFAIMGLKSDGSFASDGEVVPFDPHTETDADRILMLQLYDFTADGSQNFETIKHRRAYQELSDIVGLAGVMNKHTLDPSITPPVIPLTITPDIITFDIDNTAEYYDQFTIANAAIPELIVNRFNVYPEGVVDIQCYIDEFCPTRDPRRHKWIIPELPSYASHQLHRIRRNTGIFE